MKYHLIIHKEDVEFESQDLTISEERREKAKLALKTIEELVQQNLPKILFIGKGCDPRKIPECIKKGDEVIIYGGRHGYCLTSALMTIQLRGAIGEYHPEGYI